MQTPNEMLNDLLAQKQQLQDDLEHSRDVRKTAAEDIKGTLEDMKQNQRLINAINGRKARVTKVLEPAPDAA
jgi:hypothetical protein